MYNTKSLNSWWHLRKYVDIVSFFYGKKKYYVFKFIINNHFRNKYSIDFITENGSITEWKSNENYVPNSVYKNGLIKGLPFNVDSFGFLEVFRDKNKE